MEQKDQINNYISLPLGILTLLAGLFLSAGNFIVETGYDKIGWYFYFSLGMYLVSWIISLALLIPCLFRPYQYVLDPNGWVEYRDDLENYYNGNILAHTDDTISADLRTAIRTQYIDYSTRNSLSNYDKSDFLNKAKILILITAFLALPVVASQIYTKLHLPKGPQEVKVVNIKEIQMSNNQQGQPQKSSQPSSKPVVNTPPPKPQPKPGRILNEGLKPQAPQGRIVTANTKKNDKK